MKEYTMSNLFRIIAASALLAIGLTSASVVYAEQNPSAGRSENGAQHQGMMGAQEGVTGKGDMMGKGGMMGHMEQMGQMMESCNNMMQSRNQAPNSQFNNPSHPSPKE
jgi:hypothetical protein